MHDLRVEDTRSLNVQWREDMSWAEAKLLVRHPLLSQAQGYFMNNELNVSSMYVCIVYVCMYVCLSPEVALSAISHPFCQSAGRSAITIHQHI